MRSFVTVFGLACFLLASAAVRSADQPEPPSAPAAAEFFNGKSLDGWEGLKEYWQVKDGAIVGATPDGLKFNTFLCSTKKYKDFELKFQVRLAGKDWTGNSGVQIRSEVF